MAIEPMYPDVLGAITGGARVNIDKLQCALGVFPRRSYLNQPAELVLVLQNMVDQTMKVQVAVQLPIENAEGRPAVFDAPKTSFAFNMDAGEVSALRIPILALSPTPPGADYPVRVAVRYRAPEGRAVRLASGGAPPTLMKLSPIKFQVLKEVEFSAELWHGSADILTTYFDIAAKAMPFQEHELKPRYDILWKREEMNEERRRVQEKAPDARRVASTLTQDKILPAVLFAVEDRYTRGGLTLSPAEARAITKMIVYTLDGLAQRADKLDVRDTIWFSTLCQVLLHDPKIEEWDKGDLVVEYLLEAAVYDAMMMAYRMIEPIVKGNVGNQADRVSYTNRLLTWMIGQGDSNVSYIYLPLAMGGVMVNHKIGIRGESPWTIIDELRKTYVNRSRLLKNDEAAVFDMLNKVLDQEEKEMKRAGIRRTSTGQLG